MKYCNLCGAQLRSAKDKVAIEATEKRLDDYLDGLFWITVFGLGLILGGMALIKKVLHLSDAILIAYLAISSAVFLINFWLSLEEVARMRRSLKEEDGAIEAKPLDTNKLGPAEERKPLEAPASITEDPTRAFEPSPKEQIGR